MKDGASGLKTKAPQVLKGRSVMQTVFREVSKRSRRRSMRKAEVPSRKIRGR